MHSIHIDVAAITFIVTLRILSVPIAISVGPEYEVLQSESRIWQVGFVVRGQLVVSVDEMKFAAVESDPLGYTIGDPEIESSGEKYWVVC